MIGVKPGDSIVWVFKQPPLLEVQQGKDEGRYGGKGQHHRSNADSKALFHGRKPLVQTSPGKDKCKPMSILW